MEGPLGTPAGTQRLWKQRLKALSLDKKCRGGRARGKHCGEVGIVCGEGENVCSKKRGEETGKRDRACTQGTLVTGSNADHTLMFLG